MSMLETCAQYILYLFEGMNLIALWRINTSLSRVHWWSKKLEEFVAFKGAYEITSFHDNIDDAPYKSESLAILKYFFEIYNENYYIAEYLERISPPKENTNVLQDSMEEEIVETSCSLDEKVEESDEQKEEEWSHPCLPSNKSNSLTLTWYDCPPLPK